MGNYENRLFNSKNVSGFAFASMIAVYVFISFIGQFIALAIFGKGSAYLAICSTFSCLSMAVVLFAILRVKKTNVFKGVNLKPCNFVYILHALAISYGMLFGFGFINDAVVQLFVNIGLNVSQLEVPLNSHLHFIVFALVLAVLPALFEECFFRGFMQDNLKGIKTYLAILTVSLSFALYHKSLAQFVYQLIYGIALGLLFNRSGSVIPCIIAHFLNNFSVICFEYYHINVNLYNPLLIISGLFILGVSLFILIFHQREKTSQCQQGLSALKDFYLPFGLFGALICLVFLIGNLFGV